MRCSKFNSSVIISALLAICLIIAPIPRIVYADPGPPTSTTATFLIIEVSAEEADALSNGSLSQEAFVNQIISLRNTAESTELPKIQDLILNNRNQGMELPAPIGPDGELIGPPIKLPSGPNGQPNPWKKVPGTPSRPWKWIPTHPIPNPQGGQPSGSWDPKDGHWDVDNGRTVRTRWLPDGTSVVEDHKPTDVPQAPPGPFEGIDPLPYILIGVAVVVLIVLVIGTGGGAAAPLIALAVVLPAS